jgi:hypothetical protein
MKATLNVFENALTVMLKSLRNERESLSCLANTILLQVLRGATYFVVRRKWFKDRNNPCLFCTKCKPVWPATDVYDIVWRRMPQDAGWIVRVAGESQMIREGLCSNVGRPMIREGSKCHVEA